MPDNRIPDSLASFLSHIKRKRTDEDDSSTSAPPRKTFKGMRGDATIPMAEPAIPEAAQRDGARKRWSDVVAEATKAGSIPTLSMLREDTIPTTEPAIPKAAQRDGARKSWSEIVAEATKAGRIPTLTKENSKKRSRNQDDVESDDESAGPSKKARTGTPVNNEWAGIPVADEGRVGSTLAHVPNFHPRYQPTPFSAFTAEASAPASASAPRVWPPTSINGTPTANRPDPPRPRQRYKFVPTRVPAPTEARQPSPSPSSGSAAVEAPPQTRQTQPLIDLPPTDTLRAQESKPVNPNRISDFEKRFLKPGRNSRRPKKPTPPETSDPHPSTSLAPAPPSNLPQAAPINPVLASGHTSGDEGVEEASDEGVDEASVEDILTSFDVSSDDSTADEGKGGNSGTTNILSGLSDHEVIDVDALPQAQVQAPPPPPDVGSPRREVIDVDEPLQAQSQAPPLDYLVDPPRGEVIDVDGPPQAQSQAPPLPPDYIVDPPRSEVIDVDAPSQAQLQVPPPRPNNIVAPARHEVIDVDALPEAQPQALFLPANYTVVPPRRKVTMRGRDREDSKPSGSFNS